VSSAFRNHPTDSIYPFLFILISILFYSIKVNKFKMLNKLFASMVASLLLAKDFDSK